MTQVNPDVNYAGVYTEVQEKKLLLKQAQPPSFNGEGSKVEQDAEVWVEAMEDYFSAAGTTPANQPMLARFRLTGDAKLWWKQWCKDMGVTEGSQTWENIRNAVKGRYLPPAHEVSKMNEFFALKQETLTLEEFYSKFVTLRRYAPALTNEQQVARFCESLNEPLGTTLEAMKPISLQDALERAKPLSKGITYTPTETNSPSNHGPKPKHHQAYSAPTPYRPRVYLANTTRPHSPGSCHECGEMGHFWRACPRLNRGRGPQAQRSRGGANGARGGRGGRNGNGGKNENGGRNENAGQGRGRGANARVNVVYAEPTLGGYEEEQRATHFTTNDNLRADQQYTVIQAPIIRGENSGAPSK